MPTARTKGWLYPRWYASEDVVAFAERYISVKEAAVLLGCSELTVRSWARAGSDTPQRPL
jgi:DNA-directed RNA polymerase specialized sigma24 family protein